MSTGPKSVEAGVDPVNATTFDITLPDGGSNGNAARRQSTNRRYDEDNAKRLYFDKSLNNENDNEDIEDGRDDRRANNGEVPRTLSFNVTHTYYRSLLTDYSAALASSNDYTDRRLATGLSFDYDSTTKRCRRRGRPAVAEQRDRQTNFNGEFFDNRPIPFTFNYWINPYELPERISIYDSRGRAIYNLTSEHAREKLNVVARVVKQVFEEFELPHKRVNDIIDYYESLDLLYYPRNAEKSVVSSNSNRYAYDERTKTYRLQRSAIRRGEFLPIQIHFRSKPYPQSTFMEFVSDRNRVWRVYDSRFYDSYSDGRRSERENDDSRRSVNGDGRANDDETAITRIPGNDDDLLYRLRHNLRHSLGLGHTTSKSCVMYPTNVLGLNRPCEHERIALHRFLCDRSLSLRGEQ
ncbi:hypothetical protein KPH14_013106 [Odynerus spinipes]|uniref:Uncharacterized protein n=1 Tax=Odynerus spinipes TaxID=1348599 RepID=A0AAD9R8B1_9HYME|nr:hypothetical protein KPH14_013106 [Odynerus spinipes]